MKKQFIFTADEIGALLVKDLVSRGMIHPVDNAVNVDMYWDIHSNPQNNTIAVKQRQS